MRLGKRTLDYKWVILIVCCLMEFICLGFCSSNEGLYLVAVTDIGIPATYIATTATVSSLTLTCSKFLLGYTYI